MQIPLLVSSVSMLVLTAVMGARPSFGSAWDEGPLGHEYTYPKWIFKENTRNLRVARIPKKRRLEGALKVGDGSDPKCVPDFSTIAEALEHISNGGTILLCKGVFNEAVTIEKDFRVKIVGQGKGLSVIRSPPGAVSVVNAAAGGVNLQLEKLTLDGGSKMAGGVQGVAGLACEACHATVSEIEIINIFSTDSSVSTIGIFAQSLRASAEHTISIQYCDILDVGVLGVFVDGPGLSGTIKNNNIVGADPPRSNVAIGIQVSRQAFGEVHHNFVSHFNSPRIAMPSTGINILCPAPETNVKYNVVKYTDLGVTLIDASNVYVQNNDISNSKEAGISLEYQLHTGCPSPTAANNLFKGNKINDSQVFGLRFAISPLAEDTGIVGNTVYENEIVDSGVGGIAIFAGSKNTLKSNKIMKSGMGGIGVIAGRGNLFENNGITDSVHFGILVQGGEDNIYLTNKIYQSGESGIGVSGGVGCFYDKNSILKSVKNDIYLFEDADVPVAEHNLFMDNEVDTSKLDTFEKSYIKGSASGIDLAISGAGNIFLND